MTDYLEQKYREISARIAELAPIVDEHHRLTAAADALAALGLGSGPKAASISKQRIRGRRESASAKRPRQPEAKTPKSSGNRKPTKADGGGRAAQAFSLVQRQPGITIAELAKALGIQRSYLYRILPALQKDGRVTRQGNGWHPAGS